MSVKNKLIKKQAHALELLQVKIAELEEEASILAGAAQGLDEEKNALAEEIAEKTEKLTEMATSEGTSDSVDDEAKELLIDTVAKIDPELADALADEIEGAEDSEEGLTAPKLASIVVSTLNSYSAKTSASVPHGTLRTNTKTASAKDSGFAHLGSEKILDNMLAGK